MPDRKQLGDVVSFYGLVIMFVAVCIAVYISAFASEMAYESAINLAFARGSAAIITMSYLSVAHAGNLSQSYINYTLSNLFTR